MARAGDVCLPGVRSTCRVCTRTQETGDDGGGDEDDEEDEEEEEDEDEEDEYEEDEDEEDEEIDQESRKETKGRGGASTNHKESTCQVADPDNRRAERSGVRELSGDVLGHVRAEHLTQQENPGELVPNTCGAEQKLEDTVNTKTRLFHQLT